MGQQQLLLLVLGIVIVGLAVVVGIQAFGENQKKANIDAMTNDGIRIASDAQSWVLKPGAFGGGEGNPESATWAKLGYEATTDGYTNVNGVYTLTPATTSISIQGTNSANSAFVRVDVFGPSSECVATQTGSAALSIATKPTNCTGAWS